MTNPVDPADRAIFLRAREANLVFSIHQSHTPTKMEIPIGNGNLKPRFFSNGSISPKFLSITQKNPFSRLEGENPYNHLGVLSNCFLFVHTPIFLLMNSESDLFHSH
jgi:hypothetical protein